MLLLKKNIAHHLLFISVIILNKVPTTETFQISGIQFSKEN